MPYSTHRPELMGRAELEPAGAFEAGSWASFALTYTAGRYGMDDTASLKVAFRFATDMTPCQFDDPAAPGYTTVEASNGARLQVRWDVKGNIRPFDKTLYIKVAQGFMAEGDRLVVRFGDTRRGSPGMRLQTFCEDRFTFLVLADPIATYDYVPLPEQPAIAIVPGPPAAWKAVLPTLRRPGQPFRLAIKAEDRWGNPSDRADATLRLRPSRPVGGLPETVALRPGTFAAVVEDLAVDEPGDLVIDVLDEAGGVLTRSSALRIDAAAERLHFWADLHGQSGETIGTNPARSYFAFARDRAFVDVASHQGNDFQITQAFWRELNELTAEFDQPGRFVAIPGYEWSGNTALGGDRNVWFRHEGRPIRRSSHALVGDRSDEAADCTTAAELLEALRGEDVVVAAHVGGRYADIGRAHDGRIEHSVEVHSAWGTFEWLLDDAFERGYRVGVLANSDGHKGRPGASYPGASLFGAYGGLTCLLTPELSRDAVFEALRRRHHYGTTGARVVLDARARFDSPAELFERDPAVVENAPCRAADGAVMGDVVRVQGDAVTFAVDVLAASPIERVDLRDGPETLETIRPYGPADLGARVRVIWEGAEYRGRGRQVGWDGRALLGGNRFARVRPINFWNPERTLDRDGPAAVRWRSITTGNFAGFDAWLEDPEAGALAIETPHVACEIPVRDIGFDDLAFDAGGLGRRLRVFRLPDANPHSGLRFERRLPVRAGGDTRPYVRVTLEDGHQAWSSPIYLFR